MEIMIHGKNLQIKKRTMLLTLECSDNEICNLDRYEFLALSLLHGFYNPLRKYSKGDPIDMHKLEEFNSRYVDLITDMIGEMKNIDVEEIEKI